MAPNNVSTEVVTFLRRMPKPKRLDWVKGAVSMLVAEALTHQCKLPNPVFALA